MKLGSGGAACHHGTFNDCVSHSGSDPEQNVDGFAIGHGTQHDFTFNRCETYGVYDGFDIGENEGGGVSNVVLNRCSAHECGNGGFKLWGHQVTLVNCLAYRNTISNIELDWGGNPGTTLLRSCTIMDAGTFNVWVENSTDSLRMYNCILAGSDNIGLSFEQQNAGSYRGDYNLFHDDDGNQVISVGYEDQFTLNEIAAGDWTGYSGQDAHSRIVGSPGDLFEDPGTFDLHVLEESEAVDNGTAMNAPAEDYDGNPRPSGSGYDIGAYEYQSGIGAENERGQGRVGSLRLLVSPQPVTEAVVITYGLSHACCPTLAIYDLAGRQVRRLADSYQEPGTHQIMWDCRDDAALRVGIGAYVCRLNTGNDVASRRVIVVR